MGFACFERGFVFTSVSLFCISGKLLVKILFDCFGNLGDSCSYPHQRRGRRLHHSMLSAVVLSQCPNSAYGTKHG